LGNLCITIYNMARFLRAAALATAFSSVILAADNIPTCGPGNPCPADTPCCSAYGQCGIGAYCLGGCDPLFSHKLTSCVPNPACKSQDYKLSSLSDVQDIGKYLGDNSKANWVASGNPLAYNNQGLLLTMPPDTVGTLLASTNYVWYGKICASLTTSQGAGVVTAFIMMSDVKDEIDFEFVGVDVDHAQSNYYSQGVTNYNNEVNLTASSTSTTVHQYCIDWNPDTLTWYVDGKNLRTLKRSDTWNSTSNRFDYPQTPARIMLSLWPAGLPSNPKGTVDWSGGLIDWSSQYMKNGYYYALVSDVSVNCYDPPSGAKMQGSKSYVYTDPAGTNNTVQGSNNVVILKSLYASGDNPNIDPNASKSASDSKSSPTNSPQTVPGVVGAGSRGDSGSSDSGDGSNPSGTQSAGSSATGSSGGSSFSQGSGSTGGDNKSSATGLQDRSVGGSVFAVLIAVAAMLCL
jgi:beta-glucanase (GH16 family)